ncbi:hypothetical protein FPRO05_14301 [Fusarium proliferatum]|uniref:Amino acid transporter transmembrane domain-containing protein n=1 Tax=Gibberella intermedia TaxID=948311 RepID=A0A365MR44_GIBIN|nr:hypothetical protein FPRO05_14301 [Fusarium proliferatum]
MLEESKYNMTEKNRDSPELGHVPSQAEGVMENQRSDAVFGEITEKGPNYRNVNWLGTVAIMMKICIGLGILSIPSGFDILGLIPGIICLLTIGAITTWSSYMVGVFKINHPEVYGLDDTGEILFGRIGRYLFGGAFCITYIFVAGSGMLGISIGLNAVSEHGTCTAAFVAVAAIVAIGLSSIRTLGKIQWLAWIGIICIIISVFILTVAVGIQDRPSAAPSTGQWKSDYKLFGNPTFMEAATALTTFVFAYAGTPAFFGVVAEMRNPQEYTKALILCQSIMTVLYLIIGIVVYYYCGSFVASPALGSAGPMIKKICYGISLPGLLITTTLCLHLPAKYILVRALRDSKHLNSNSKTHWMVWIGCTFGTGLIAYIIASAIPIFGSLVSLIGALCITFLAFHPMACMWLYDNWSKGKVEKPLRWKLMVGWCVLVLIIGTFLMITGTWGSVVAIVDSYRASGGSSAWSCTDNSNST